MEDARSRLLVRAAERRKRLANLESPEFVTWFDQHVAEFLEIPFPMTYALLMAHSRGQAEVYTTCEPQAGREREDQRLNLFPT